jgi:hypothetical protein
VKTAIRKTKHSKNRLGRASGNPKRKADPSLRSGWQAEKREPKTAGASSPAEDGD